MKPYAKNPDGTTLKAQHEGDAGVDLRYTGETVTIPNGQTIMLETGVHTIMDQNTVGLVCSRSGLARSGITVANQPGIVDSGFKDSVKVLIHNNSGKPHTVETGDRIAQLLFIPIHAPLAYNSERGEGGFGSSGIK